MSDLGSGFGVPFLPPIVSSSSISSYPGNGYAYQYPPNNQPRYPDQHTQYQGRPPRSTRPGNHLPESTQNVRRREDVDGNDYHRLLDGGTTRTPKQRTEERLVFPSGSNGWSIHDPSISRDKGHRPAPRSQPSYDHPRGTPDDPWKRAGVDDAMLEERYQRYQRDLERHQQEQEYLRQQRVQAMALYQESLAHRKAVRGWEQGAHYNFLPPPPPGLRPWIPPALSFDTLDGRSNGPTSLEMPDEFELAPGSFRPARPSFVSVPSDRPEISILSPDRPGLPECSHLLPAPRPPLNPGSSHPPTFTPGLLITPPPAETLENTIETDVTPAPFSFPVSGPAVPISTPAAETDTLVIELVPMKDPPILAEKERGQEKEKVMVEVSEVAEEMPKDTILVLRIPVEPSTTQTVLKPPPAAKPSKYLSARPSNAYPSFS
jgi:hypothetical protein